MGVTIETWRARIGLHSQPNKSQKTTTTQGMTTGGGSFSCRPRHILMVIGLLLLLSGNVELNPGPSSRRQQPPQQNNPSNRPYTNKDESFTTTEVLDILQNPDFSRVTTQPPVKPRAGQAFLYHFTDVNKRDDWRCDQYHFHHNATREQPKADPKFKKLFFVIKTREGKDKRFKKHAYIHLAEDNHLVLFQYIGDERIAEDLPHGNSKNASVPYIRLCPSVIRAIKDVSSNFTETLTSLNRQAATSDVPEVYKPRSRLHVMNTRYRGQKDCTKENHTNSLDKTGEPTLYNLAVALKKDTEVDKIVPEKGKRKKPKRLKNLQHIVRASSDFPDNQDNLRPTEDSHVMPVRNPKTPLDFRLVESNTALSTAGVDNTQVLHSETGETDHLHPLTCDGANVPQTISREKTDQGASEVVDFLKTILQDQCITSSNSISANAPSTHVKENELTFSSSEDGSCQITCQDNNKSNSDIAVQASGKETPALVENDNSENTQPASLENFIHAIVNDGRLGKIFQLLHQIQSTWNVSQQQSYCQHRADEHWAFEHEASAHRSSGNSCIKDNGSQWLSSSLPLTASTLITQVKNLWESDFNLTSDLLLKTETVQQYTNSNTFPPLLASLVLGAFKMQTDIVEFMETLKERPGHLKPAGNDISVEVSNDVRFSIGRYTVVGQDLMKLNKSSWLDDSVIHAYLYLLEDRFSKEGTKIFILECFVAEFWEKKNYGECLYKEVALVEYTWILMPMCRHSHWILLAANIRNGDVCVINSIPSEDTQRNILQHWRAYMACRSRETKENLSTWREIQCPVFPQTDGNSCGVHILMAAEALLSGVCPAVMRNCHVSGYREFVKHQLLDAAEMHTNDNEEINVHSPEEVEIIEIPIDTSASKQDVEAEDFRKRTSTQTSVIDVHNQSVICEELVGDISNIEVEPSTVTTHERLDKCGGLTDNTNIIVTESIHISENTGSMEITATSDMVPSEPHDTTPGLCPEDIRSYCEELFQNQKSSFVGLTLVCFMKGRLPLTALDDQENTSPLKDYIKWGCQLCNCEATTNAEIRNAFLGLEKLVLTSEQNSLVILRNTDIKRALSTVIADHLQEYIDIIDLKFIFFHIRVNEQDGGFYVCLKGKMVEDLARRFAKEVLQSNLALVLSHDSFGYFHFNLLFLKAVKRQLKSDDIQIILENSDSTFGGTFIHWMCFGRNAELFKSLSFCLTANQKAACLTPCCISGNSNIVQLLCIETDLTDCLRNPKSRLTLPGIAQNMESPLTNIESYDTHALPALHLSSLYGHTGVVSNLLENGFDVNAQLVEGSGTNIPFLPMSTAALAAATKGNIDVVKCLIQHGADLNLHDIMFNAPIHSACRSGNRDLVALIARQCCISEGDAEGNTPLHIACKRGESDNVSILLERGADCTVLNYNNEMPLDIVCKEGFLDVAKVILNQRGYPLPYDGSNTPLHKACAAGFSDIIELLLQYDADRSVTVDDQNPLLTAAYSNNADVVKILLNTSAANIVICDSKIVSECLEKGHIGMVKLLLKKGASLTANDMDRYSPLARACEKGDIEMVKLLLEKGASVTAIDRYGYSPLARACQKGDIEIVKLLLEKGESVTAIDRYGYLPLARACQKGDIEIVKLLLEKGASVTAIDMDGYSPLARACKKGDIEIVKLLLEKGASVTAIDRYRYLPLAIACEKGDMEIVKLLLEKGASVTAIDMHGYSPLATACQEGYIEIVKLLLVKTASVSDTVLDKYSPLARACEKGHIEIVKLLLEKRLSVSDTDIDGYLPLVTACGKGVCVSTVYHFFRLSIKRLQLDVTRNIDISSFLKRVLQKKHFIMFRMLLPILPSDVSPEFFLQELCCLDSPQVLLLLTEMCNGICLQNTLTAAEDLKNVKCIEILNLLNTYDVKGILLHRVVACGYMNLVKRYFEKFPSSHHADSCVMIASRYGHTAIVEWLLHKYSNDMTCRELFGRCSIQTLFDDISESSVTEYRKDTTSLFEACYQGHTNIVRLLLQYEMYMSDQAVSSSFHLVCERGNIGVLHLLLDSGLYVDHVDETGSTGLYICSRNARDSAVQVLLENGANPCHVNNEGETPLHAAMESNNFTVMKSLLRYTTSFSNVPVSMLNNGYLFKLVSENIHEKSLAAVDSDSNSLLHHAVRFGFPDSVATLLERGVDGSLTNCKKETAMHIAAERGCRKSVRLLIRYHHTSNVENMDKQTPLHCAASEGHLNIVKDLIDCDSNVSLKGCLHYAAKSGHVETVQCLINKGAVINETYCQSDTPLHHACESGNIQTVNVLLSSRADVNAQGHKGRTPLHIACARGYDGIVDCLLNHGADPNLRNKFNNTSLLSAVVEGHLDVIKVMMIKGAKAEISGANGSNYLIACCTRGHLHVARYLIENGANISSIGLQCISPFSVSLSDILEDERETIEDIQNTVRSGIEGMTSLHAAMDGNHFDVAEYLMNQGADVLENDQYGKSVLMKICEKGNLQVTKAFLSSGSVFPSVLRKHIIKGFTLQKTQTSSQCEKKSSDSVAVRETGHVIEVIDEPDTDSVNVPPVKVACDCDHGDVASLLIAYSAGWLSDMDDSHLYDGKSPLHLAYDAGFMDVVACLLSSATNSNAVDSNGHTIFHKACEHGDVKTLQNILKFNVEIKQQLFIKSKDGEMLSHITSRRGHLHILQMLLEAGMDLDHLTDEGDNVLHLACSYDKYRVCTFLLDTSPNLAWVKNHNGFTPLDMAIGTGNDKIVRIFFAHAKLTQYGRMQNTIWMYLCESMDNINRLNVLVRCSNVMEMTDNHGNTPFHIAAMTGSTRAIDCLLKHDRKDCVKLSNSDGDTPLHVASHQGHSAVVRILSPNFETNVANNLGDTPLHVSCLNAQRGSVLTLLSADSNVNAENNCGDTPLHMVLHSFFTMPDAKLAETIRIIHHLLAYAADPCCQNINRNTPLHVACSLGKIEIVASLLTYYKDLNIMNRCGKTPLHVACEYDHSAIVDLLLELIWLRTLQNGDGGVYVDYQDIESATSLHIACRRNSVQSVSLLLEHGAGTTIKDNNGNMPVFVACEAGCVQVVRQLLPYSSHQDVNRFGETLLLVACRNGHEDMFQIIVHWVYHGADQNMARWFLNVPVPIHMNMTALHISSHIKNVHFVEQLLLRGAAPNTRDVHGQTALHYSCINACRVIVSVLLKYMADVSVCDEHLRTPLHYACERGSLDIAEMLVMAGGNLYVRDRDGRTPLDMCSTGHRVLLKQSLRYLRKRQSTSSEDSPCSSKRIRYDSTKRGCTFEDAQTCPRPRSVPQLRRSHSMGETRCVSSDGQCFQE
ncbi:uncharacterized protein LOC124260704 isoform X4 [Haliotis rubra]|uniref:uncharacterized protein LOC124260704 isoform X4 n=1 Tax=Haliotis rubra TaxID=36100 RepID=UPI001EE57BC2|nr:uncharacterized protein LOC124260704 isoform X4 [Haliotis rubra]